MLLEQELTLTESLANLGKSDFESILREELRREYRTLLAADSEEEGMSDIDAVEIRIEKVEREKWFGQETLVSVHVMFDKIVPGANSQVTRSRCEKRITVVLNPDADDRLRFKACVRVDTNRIYGDEDA